MRAYWVMDKTSGDKALLDYAAIEKRIGIEFDYVAWCIEEDGVFENADWRVWKPKADRG